LEEKEEENEFEVTTIDVGGGGEDWRKKK